MTPQMKFALFCGGIAIAAWIVDALWTWHGDEVARRLGGDSVRDMLDRWIGR